MKIFKSLKIKILLTLIFIIAICTTISYATEEGDLLISSQNSAPVATSEETSNNTDSIVSTTETTSEVPEKDLFISGFSVNIDYNVSGNVFIFANDVNIDGIIDGNVFIFANRVTISENSYIYSDLFVVGADVSVKGYVYDLYSLSNNLNIASSACIIRDITSSANTINLEGSIRRNATINFNNIIVNETSAKIDGDLHYSTSSQNAISESIVSGNVTFEESRALISQESIVKHYFMDLLEYLVLAIIVLLIIIFIAHKFTEKTPSLLKNKLGSVLGFGSLALILIPICCLILLLTVVGILPSVIILLAYILMVTISPIIVAVSFGKLICQKMNKDTKPMVLLISILVAIAIWLLNLIPIINILVSLASSILGLGIIVCSIFSKKEQNVVDTSTNTIDINKEDISKKD